MYLLTDASFDDDQSGGLGGVLFNSGIVLERLSIVLESTQVQQLIHGDSQVVIIGELEALAPVMALDLWKRHCRSCHFFFFIGNDGARYNLIRGYSCSVSLSSPSRRMMAVSLEELVCLQWFVRVASASSLAVFQFRGKPHPILSEDLMCKQAATLGVFKSIDEFLVEPKERVGLGQVASKTNGSPSKARGLKRKLIHGMPANSNLAKGSPKKTRKKVRVVSCIDMSVVIPVST